MHNAHVPRIFEKYMNHGTNLDVAVMEIKHIRANISEISSKRHDANLNGPEIH